MPTSSTFGMSSDGLKTRSARKPPPGSAPRAPPPALPRGGAGPRFHGAPASPMGEASAELRSTPPPPSSSSAARRSRTIPRRGSPAEDGAQARVGRQHHAEAQGLPRRAPGAVRQGARIILDRGHANDARDGTSRDAIARRVARAVASEVARQVARQVARAVAPEVPEVPGLAPIAPIAEDRPKRRRRRHRPPGHRRRAVRVPTRRGGVVPGRVASPIAASVVTASDLGGGQADGVVGGQVDPPSFADDSS